MRAPIAQAQKVSERLRMSNGKSMPDNELSGILK
jgi:hypothetical protein